MLMTKMISKGSASKKLVVFFLGIFLIAPNLLLAQDRGSAARNLADNFCQRLANSRGNFQNRYDAAVNRLQDKREEHSDSLELRRIERAADIGKNRTSRDTNRERHFAAIEKRAETDEQKNAVAIFQLAVNTAVDERRKGVDQALEDFREGLDDLLQQRRENVETARARYLSATADAFSEAQGACDQGDDSQGIRQILHSSLRSATGQFQSEIRENANFRPELDELIAARRKTVNQAIEDFQEAIREAHAQLQAAF